MVWQKMWWWWNVTTNTIDNTWMDLMNEGILKIKKIILYIFMFLFLFYVDFMATATQIEFPGK